MSYYSRELVSSVNIGYYYGGHDSSLLSISELQDEVLLDDTGLAVAIGIRDGLATPFVKKSIEYTDGANGDQGGLGIVRAQGAKNELALVMKYSAQGLSHGHYDKLSFSFYNGGDEVLQDYGLTRFVNIQQKGGGNYLKENTTWAKQTIAHNTVIQNETSHFNGDFETGNLNHSDTYLFDVENPNVQVVSATEVNAYPGTQLHRTMALIKDAYFENPILLDIVNVNSETENQYDLPFYYFGQIMSTNFEYTPEASLKTLGANNGFQHLWKEAEGNSTTGNAQVTWFNNNSFYTLSSVVSEKDNLIFARIGANDPHFNLRKDPTFIIRKPKTKNANYVSVLETHGSYSPVSEIASNAFSSLKKLEIVFNTESYIGIVIETMNNEQKLFIISLKDASKDSKHTININNKAYQWVGPYNYTIIN
jgi:hypothetical protein